MSNESKSLALLGSFNQSANPTWDGKKGRVKGPTAYLAEAFGLSIDAIEAHRDSMPLVQDKKTGKMVKPSLGKACKALVLANGGDEKETNKVIRQVYADFDTHRSTAFADMRKVAAVLVSDPQVRNNLKVDFNKNGETIGATIVCRRERVRKNSDKATIAQLQAELATLRARVALPA